jgi:uncharacterized protein (DUF1778 family)
VLAPAQTHRHLPRLRRPRRCSCRSRRHLRVDPEQKALLEAASRAAGDTVSGFVLRAATEAADDIVADRRVFVLDEQAWQVFDQGLPRPAAEVPGLRELPSTPTVLDRRATEPHPAQAGRSPSGSARLPRWPELT